MKLELIPKKSIGPIELGMTKKAARLAMEQAGYPVCYEKKTMDYFCDNTIQAEYEDGTVSFIGISSEEKIELIYRNSDLFDMTSQEAFSLISSGESKKHEYEGSEYLFPDQIITLWDADSQYDYKRKEQRPVWGQIGIGDERHRDYSIKLIENTTEQVGRDNIKTAF